MTDVRHPDQPDAVVAPEPAERTDARADVRTDARADRPRLRDSYVDDDADIFQDDRERGADGDQPADATDAGTDADADTGGETDGDTATDLDPDPDLDEALNRLAADHPEAGSVLRKLVADGDHSLDLTRALRDPERRGATLAVVRELAEGRLLRGGDLQRFREENPGQGVLFADVPPEVNRTADGLSRRDTYLARCEMADPARRVGGLPDARQREAVDAYASRLVRDVEPVVSGEAERLAASFPDATVSIRVKNADEILDKVGRMTSGSDTRPPREDYRVGHVVDAVGARITVDGTEQLGRLVEEVCGTLGVGDGGRVLELDNMYAAPKPSNPSYRVVPLVVAVEAEGVPYTYELQLTTRRASVAADMEHNTIYKPYVNPTAEETGAVRRMLAEAAALDQDETRRVR
jgi:ppGpp synthetase/RelA/SpoT-type nucleotidyltranferase